jgi:hypothetical protein
MATHEGPPSILIRRRRLPLLALVALALTAVIACAEGAAPQRSTAPVPPPSAGPPARMDAAPDAVAPLLTDAAFDAAESAQHVRCSIHSGRRSPSFRA